MTEADKQRLIRALKILDSGENLDQAVNVDQVLRYFTVQVFVMNWDSYLGRTGHNYFLYEEDGVISMLPWDYNLAFGTYALGMTDPIRDPNILINYPIFTPAEGEVMRERPLYHNLMKNDRYFQQYQKYFDQFLREYFESGLFSVRLRRRRRELPPMCGRIPRRSVPGKIICRRWIPWNRSACCGRKAPEDSWREKSPEPSGGSRKIRGRAWTLPI